MTGQLGTIESQSSVGATGSLQNLSYGYNTLGEMDVRTDSRNGYSETFTYDVLGRMKSSTVTQGTVVTPRNYSYDDLGNLACPGFG